LARGHVDIKALKMALYGFLISAPLGHFLVGALQKAFAGKTGTSAKIAQIFANNLLVAPIQVAGKWVDRPEGGWSDPRKAYLSSIAIINGAESLDEVVKFVRGGFLAVLRVSTLDSDVYPLFV
jgi:peroxisomal membrane protein 2